MIQSTNTTRILLVMLTAGLLFSFSGSADAADAAPRERVRGIADLRLEFELPERPGEVVEVQIWGETLDGIRFQGRGEMRYSSDMVTGTDLFRGRAQIRFTALFRAPNGGSVVVRGKGDVRLSGEIVVTQEGVLAEGSMRFRGFTDGTADRDVAEPNQVRFARPRR